MTRRTVKAAIVAASISVLLLSTGCDYLVPPAVQEIDFTKEVDEKTASTVIASIKASSGSERILLTISSPGGRVDWGRRIIAQMLSSGNVDTYVSELAASMGAEMFIVGKNRYAAKSALIVFHGARAGEWIFSENILAKFVSILKDDRFKRVAAQALRAGPPPDSGAEESQRLTTQEELKEYIQDYIFSAGRYQGTQSVSAGTTDVFTDPLNAPYISFLLDLVMKQTYDVALIEMQSMYEHIKKINELQLMSFDAIIEQSNGKWTRERIKKVIYGDYTKDMMFTGEELFNLGLVTALGKPPTTDKE